MELTKLLVTKPRALNQLLTEKDATPELGYSTFDAQGYSRSMMQVLSEAPYWIVHQDGLPQASTNRGAPQPFTLGSIDESTEVDGQSTFSDEVRAQAYHGHGLVRISIDFD